MVDEKTDELLSKNKELEIEAALERVRTVAMSMTTSDNLLSICEVTFKELQKLGFDNLRNAVIHIPNDVQKYIMDYDYSEFTGGNIAKIKYGSHPIVDEYRKKIMSSEDAFFEVYEEGDWIVSGHCPKGGDAFAEKIAFSYGIPILLFPPKKHRREEFFARNTLIAYASDIIIACLINPHDSIEDILKRKSGGSEDTLKKFRMRMEHEYGINRDKTGRIIIV